MGTFASFCSWVWLRHKQLSQALASMTSSQRWTTAWSYKLSTLFVLPNFFVKLFHCSDRKLNKQNHTNTHKQGHKMAMRKRYDRETINKYALGLERQLTVKLEYFLLLQKSRG